MNSRYVTLSMIAGLLVGWILGDCFLYYIGFLKPAIFLTSALKVVFFAATLAVISEKFKN